ncbi:MAG: phosphate acyltransferase PlsX [Bacteroidales bacterium]|nr:phosphate acyltransferase PlsX [Bacteroidales bacterium]MCF8327391.1 phosphate acyltransferase PlsX [Bacteroidales bacterium]
MIFGIDAMGGDHAPSAIIEGAVEAQGFIDPKDTILLIGDEELIRDHLSQYKYSKDKIQIKHASQVIDMHDQPTRAFSSKTDSSINVGFRMLKEGEIDSFASSGNTGVMLVGSYYEIGVVQGLLRPTTTALVPKENGGSAVLLDVGTNPDVKPDVLNQFAVLGSIYAESLLGIKNPRVALLNIGSEDKKGNILLQSTFPLLQENKEINFVGNIEGRDIFDDKTDVIVTDGYTGNIVLKQLEAFHDIMVKRHADDPFVKRMDFENFGATPVIGINKPVLIGHGISGVKAFKNMILSSKKLISADLKSKIREKLSQNIVL